MSWESKSNSSNLTFTKVIPNDDFSDFFRILEDQDPKQRGNTLKGKSVSGLQENLNHQDHISKKWSEKEISINVWQNEKQGLLQKIKKQKQIIADEQKAKGNYLQEIHDLREIIKEQQRNIQLQQSNHQAEKDELKEMMLRFGLEFGEQKKQLQKDLSDQKIHFERTIEENTTLIKNHKSDITNLIERVSSLESTIKKLHEEKSALVNENEKYKQENTSLKDQISLKDRKIFDLTNENREKEIESGKVSFECQLKTQQYDELYKNWKDLGSKYEVSNADAILYEIKAEERQHTIRKLADEKSELESKLKEKTETEQFMAEKLYRKKMKIDGLKSENTALNIQLSEEGILALVDQVESQEVQNTVTKDLLGLNQNSENDESINMRILEILEENANLKRTVEEQRPAVKFMKQTAELCAENGLIDEFHDDQGNLDPQKLSELQNPVNVAIALHNFVVNSDYTQFLNKFDFNQYITPDNLYKAVCKSESDATTREAELMERIRALEAEKAQNRTQLNEAKEQIRQLESTVESQNDRITNTQKFLRHTKLIKTTTNGVAA